MALLLHVATTNPGKLRDFEVASKPHARDVQFARLPGMERIEPPAEDGATFEENARIKAIEYSRHAPGTIVLADDSGLEIDALHGAPGVRSARYAADAGFDPEPIHATDDDTRNNAFLLENMRGVPALRRTGRYRCVLAAAPTENASRSPMAPWKAPFLKLHEGAGALATILFFMCRSCIEPWRKSVWKRNIKSATAGMLCADC